MTLEYHVAYGENRIELIKNVNLAIHGGYEPIGGMAVQGDSFYQAMVQKGLRSVPVNEAAPIIDTDKIRKTVDDTLKGLGDEIQGVRKNIGSWISGDRKF